MGKANFVCSPLTGYFKLSYKYCLTSEKKKQEMRQVHYTSVVDSLIYAMVCTRLNIAHAIGLVSRFLSNLRKRILDRSEVDSYISKRHFQDMFMFWW